MSFTHLIIECSNRHNEELLHYRNTHNIILTITGFSHVSFNYNNFPPLKIKTKTQLFILKKNTIKSDIKKNLKKIVNKYNNKLNKKKKEMK